MKRITNNTGLYDIIFQTGSESSLQTCVKKVYQIALREGISLAGLLIEEETLPIPIFGYMPKETALKYAYDSYLHRGYDDEQEEQPERFAEIPGQGIYDILFNADDEWDDYSLQNKHELKTLIIRTGDKLGGICFRNSIIPLFGESYMNLGTSVIYALDKVREILRKTEIPRPSFKSLSLYAGKGIYDAILDPSMGTPVDKAIEHARMYAEDSGATLVGLDFNNKILPIFGSEIMSAESAIRFASEVFDRENAREKEVKKYDFVRTDNNSSNELIFISSDPGFTKLGKALDDLWEITSKFHKVIFIYNDVHIPLFGEDVMNKEDAVRTAIDYYLGTIGAVGGVIGEPIKFEDADHFYSFERKNKNDTNSQIILRFALSWARVMQKTMIGGVLTEDIIEKAKLLVDIDGIKSYMFYPAKELLIWSWAYGEQLA